MKNTSVILAAAAAAALLTTGVTFAAEADGPAKFEVADKNGDGAVDAAEHKAAGLQFDFTNNDTDGNGSLSKDEYQAALDAECA